MSELITCDIHKLTLNENALKEFLTFTQDEYDPFIMKGYARVDNDNVVVKNIEHIVAALDRNDSTIDCYRLDDKEAIYYEELKQPSEIPYTYSNDLPKYINACLELEAVEQTFSFAEWKLYCVLSGITLNNYDKYKHVLNYYKQHNMPNKDMPISRAYEITKLPIEIQQKSFKVNDSIKSISDLSIKQIQNWQDYIIK